MPTSFTYSQPLVIQKMPSNSKYFPIQGNGPAHLWRTTPSSILENCVVNSFHFVHAVVSVAYSQLSASVSTLCSDRNQHFVNGHTSIMCFMVCCCLYLQEDDLSRPHLCRFVKCGPWPVFSDILETRAMLTYSAMYESLHSAKHSTPCCMKRSFRFRFSKV